MELGEIKKKFLKLEGVESSAALMAEEGARIHWSGLVGSSKAFCASAVCGQVPSHHVFVLNTKEEAAYFLNDLQSVNPNQEKNILFFPDTHKSPYQIEETENAHVVQRAEVLEAARQKQCLARNLPSSIG